MKRNRRSFVPGTGELIPGSQPRAGTCRYRRGTAPCSPAGMHGRSAMHSGLGVGGRLGGA